jgi:hypothetical protein
VVWLFIWLALAVLILVVTFWTYAILIKQKSVWAAFAERYNLKLRKQGFFISPIIEGQFKELDLQVFSERQTMPDGRGHQYRSVIQFVLPPNMPTDGVIASRYFTPFVGDLNLPKKWKLPKEMKWEEEPLARVGVAARLKTFLTEDRMRALEVVANIKKSTFVFIFDETEGYLRVESPDPLDDGARMDKIVHKLYSIAMILSVKDDEIDGFNELAGREEAIEASDSMDHQDDEEDDEGDDAL